jgi:hypothetical protein
MSNDPSTETSTETCTNTPTTKKGRFDDVLSAVDGLRLAREAAHAQIKSEIAKERMEHKLDMYKVKSAIKYEGHVRNEKTEELRTELNRLRD